MATHRAVASLSADENVQVCPRCGGDNRCALSPGAASAAECWCATVVIDPGRLASYPGKAMCLCRSCAEAQPDTGVLRP